MNGFKESEDRLLKLDNYWRDRYIKLSKKTNK